MTHIELAIAVLKRAQAAIDAPMPKNMDGITRIAEYAGRVGTASEAIRQALEELEQDNV